MFSRFAGAALVAPRSSEFASSANFLTVPVPLVARASLSETLCGPSHTTGIVPLASSQHLCLSQESSVLINMEVVSLAEHWLTLHMGRQDTHISRCPLGVLETHVTSLYEHSKQQVPAYLM